MDKKIKTELLTLCDHAMTSQQGKLSVIGLFDRIFVTQLPSKYPRFFIVAIVSGKSGTSHEVELRVKTPTGKALLPKRSVSLKLGGNGKANVLTDVANLTFEEVGEYTIEIVTDEDQVGSTSFFVSKVVPKDQATQKKN